MTLNSEISLLCGCSFGLVALQRSDIQHPFCQVRLLVNEQLSTGRQTATSDGKNNCGQRVSSGVHLYRHAAEGFVASYKNGLTVVASDSGSDEEYVLIPILFCPASHPSTGTKNLYRQNCARVWEHVEHMALESMTRIE